jgi:hypothetical protein
MKSTRIASLIALSLIVWTMTSCISSTTTTTAPDGTVTVTKVTAPSGDALNAAVAGAGILAPILAEK